jgi:hypothetical protein
MRRKKSAGQSTLAGAILSGLTTSRGLDLALATFLNSIGVIGRIRSGSILKALRAMATVAIRLAVRQAAAANTEMGLARKSVSDRIGDVDFADDNHWTVV